MKSRLSGLALCLSLLAGAAIGFAEEEFKLPEIQKGRIRKFPTRQQAQVEMQRPVAVALAGCLKQTLGLAAVAVELATGEVRATAIRDKAVVSEAHAWFRTDEMVNSDSAPWGGVTASASVLIMTKAESRCLDLQLTIVDENNQVVKSVMSSWHSAGSLAKLVTPPFTMLPGKEYHANVFVNCHTRFTPDQGVWTRAKVKSVSFNF